MKTGRKETGNETMKDMKNMKKKTGRQNDRVLRPSLGMSFMRFMVSFVCSSSVFIRVYLWFLLFPASVFSVPPW
jgi:hypothetical protein